MSSPRISSPVVPTETLPPKLRPRKAKRPAAYYAWVVLFVTANLGALILLVAREYGWALATFLLPAPWYAWQVLRASARGLGPAITHFQTDQREVWLTIDDGPHPDTTPAVLDLLDEHQARATFFLVGERAERHPELVSEILRRGHTLGNHTHTHPENTFWFATATTTAAEIDRCAAVLRAAGVETTPYFRPPVGLKNHSLHPELAKRNLDLVLWSARGFDAVDQSTGRTLERIKRHIAPGAIVLAHETPHNLRAQNQLLSELLAFLSAEKYRCVIPPDEALIRR
ncbi:MAG: polysaccharide deacetylase family protein [Nibricoccus sp.]